jgi:DNA mismatch repair protein MSH3
MSLWIMTDDREVEARLAAVEEIKESNNYKLEDVGGMLTRLPDLEKGLVRIHYGRVLSFALYLT